MEFEAPFGALVSTAEKFGDRTALIQKERKVGFRDWAENSAKFANFLRSIGIGKGDKVALHLPNGIDYAVAQFGVWGAGAVCVPLDMRITEENLKRTLEHSDTKVLVTVSEASFDACSVAASVPTVTDVVVAPEGRSGEHSFGKILEEGDPSIPTEAPSFSDHSVIYYTSGTTGEPKGILWNYRHLTAAPMIMKHFDYIVEGDACLSALPFSHGGGTVYLQNAAYFGAPLVIMERFRPAEFVRLTEKHRVTCFHIVPPIFVAVVMTDEFMKADLGSIRWVSNFGAMVNEAAVRRFGERCPNARLVNGWGLMETAPPNTLQPLDEDAPIRSVGKAPPWIELRIVDDAGKELPLGEVGEVLIRGWVVMEGYYKAPEETDEVLRDGWFHTGDLGKMDEKGYLYIVGRKKDVIIVGGLNVIATDVEGAIKGHPAVADCAVIAAKHPSRGEVVKAVVELKEGEEATEAEIVDFLRDKLESYKIPRIVEFVDELPRTRTGKVAKWQLR